LIKESNAGNRLFANENPIKNSRSFVNIVKFILLALTDFPKFARNVLDGMIRNVLDGMMMDDKK
jgi:hypothetical protein